MTGTPVSIFRRLPPLLAAVLFGLAALAAPAMAADFRQLAYGSSQGDDFGKYYEYGTPAWALRDLTLRQGPGAAYHVTGAITGKTRIIVERCAPRWCLVTQGHMKGWTSRDRVGFGTEPEDWLFNENPDYASGGPGTVCFYQGTHFSGPAICHESGFVAHDLLLYGLDDRFASVSVQGNVSASICRDRNFQSYCTRIIESEPVLGTYLYRNVSSIRIH